MVKVHACTQTETWRNLKTPMLKKTSLVKIFFKNEQQACRGLQAFSTSIHKPVENHNKQPRSLQGAPP